MRQIICCIVFCLPLLCVFGQSSTIHDIGEINPPSVALTPLRFLAYDEMMGRSPTRPEIHIAARYISEAFRSFGLNEVNGTNDYFQAFEIKLKKPAVTGDFTVAGYSYYMNKSLFVVREEDTIIIAPVIYVRHGTGNDLDGIDVKGKIVLISTNDF